MTKTISLEQMKNLSIDNLIKSYQEGFRLEDTAIENLQSVISTLQISNGIINPQSEAAYIIYYDGLTINARNGLTGRVEFSNLDAKTVIQNAINTLTSGRTWQ